MTNPIEDELLAAKIATITVAAPTTPISTIAKQLKVNHNVVRRIMNSDSYRGLLTTMTREQIAPILAKVKTDIHNLGMEAVRVLKEQLEENSLEAAKVVLKVMALDAPQEQQQEASLTVIIPGAKEEKVFEVKKDEIQDAE